MGVNLAFEAGRLAERRGWPSVELVDPDSLASVLPGPGAVIVLAPEGTFQVQHAREVAALHASGKSVAVVSPVVLAEDVRAWLPDGCFHAPESVGLGGLSRPEAASDVHRMQLVQQFLRALATDPDPAIRCIVARQSNAPDDLLRALAEDPAPTIRSIVAGNRGAPVDLLHKLISDSDSSVAIDAALNTMAPIGPSQKMMRQVSSDCRRRIDEDSDDDDAWETLEIIAQDPRCPVDLLRNLLADAKLEYIRRAIGRNPQHQLIC